MKYHFCVICYCEVIHPQQTTCGSSECRDAWKHLGRDARTRHRNLATLSPSERAYCLAQGPSVEELEDRAQRREQLDADLIEHQAQQQKKEAPAFIRDMLNPANFKGLIKDETKEESPSANDPSNLPSDNPDK